MNHPSNAFDETSSDSDEEEAAELYGSSDEEMFKNTEVRDAAKADATEHDG